MTLPNFLLIGTASRHFVAIILRHSDICRRLTVILKQNTAASGDYVPVNAALSPVSGEIEWFLGVEVGLALARYQLAAGQ